MKKKIFGILILIISYLGFDFQLYYYGLGKGLIASKIPKEYVILFAGSDLGNQGVILKENSIGGIYLVVKNENIYLKKDKKIFIKSFTGYYFNNKNIIVEIIDDTNTKKYLEINTEKKSEYIGYFFNEINRKTIKKNNYKFIDLNHPLIYFKLYKLIKNITLVTGIILTFLMLKTTLINSLKPNKKPEH